MDRIGQLVANNAAWIDMAMSALGMAGEFTPILWQNFSDMPPIFPNADTLGGTEAEQMQAIEALVERRKGKVVAVKDAWARLDLSALGFTPLFEAIWLYREVAPMPQNSDIALERIDSPDALHEFAAACNGEDLAYVYAPALLRPEIAWIAARVEGKIVGGVTAVNAKGFNGINNLFAPDETMKKALIQAAVNTSPTLPASDYTREESLAPYLELGFSTEGKLRVWLRQP